MPPRRKRFDKKSATTFSIVHRAHDDALYYDNDASKHVLVPVNSKQRASPETYSSKTTKKVYTTADLESRLGEEDIKLIRENEGLAAQYGVFFDDSNYDYMQHLKPIGETGDGVFIERKGQEKEEGEKKKIDIEDLFEDQLPSEKKTRSKDHTLKNIPDEISGFHPDMDPRLREVLEALDDEAYITDGSEGKRGNGDDDQDLFSSLIKSGEVEDEDEFFYGSDGQEYFDDDEDEWDIDNYQDEYAKYDSDNYKEQEIPYNDGDAPEELVKGESNAPMVNGDWQKDFARFQKLSKNKVNDWDSDNEFEDESGDEEKDSVRELPSFLDLKSNKKLSKTKIRRKKGAMTDTSSFSMTSSALFRSEGLTLLDDRYEQLAKKFDEDEDQDQEEYHRFDMQQERGDLESMLDDFLDNYELESGGRKLVKKNHEKTKIQKSADAVSKGKLAARRRKENTTQEGLGGLGNSFGNMKI